MNTKDLIIDYLEKSMVLQIATCLNDIPWICTVCFANDSSCNLYWFSRHDTRHSQEIILNPLVAGAVSLPYKLGDKSRGMQFSGMALELYDEPSIVKGLAVLEKRFDVKPERTYQLKQELLSKSANYGLYCLRPNSIILHDKVNFPNSQKKVYKVPNYR